MPLPVIAGTFLARLIWQNASAPRNAITDLYFHDAAGGHTGTDLYNAMNTAVLQDMWGVVTSTSKVFEVMTTKLDGSAATETHNTGSPAKWGGETSSDLILQGACVVTLRTGFRGRSYRGRIYLPWVGETAQANGTLDVTTVGTMQTAWNTFFAALNTAGWPIQVVSRKLGTGTQISSVTVQPYLKTQRRRARR